MNITRDFVFVHLPKTGGSFVTECLERLYLPNRENDSIGRYCIKKIARRLSLLRGRPNYYELNKHGTCREIPASERHLPIVSCVRNPYDWYVSNYRFGWWKTHPHIYPGLERHPRWPNLGFSDYLELSSSSWKTIWNSKITVNKGLGRLTVLFVNYYCRQPDAVLEDGLDDDALFDRLREELLLVRFLRTQDLNQELTRFLLDQGIPSHRLDFIRFKGKVKPRGNRSEDEKWESFYDDALKARVAEEDRFLFRLFPFFNMSVAEE